MPKQSKRSFHIWIGSYHLGQGYDPPEGPQHVAEVIAVSFKVACFKFELLSTYESLVYQEGQGYVGEQSLQNWYNPQTMKNDWTGQYFETEAEAWLTFPEHLRPKT